MHPRSAVLWDPGACVTVVERANDPVLHLAYSVAQDDTMLTLDELEDSRSHQFLAFSLHHADSEALPRYLSESDLARAIDAELQDASELTPDPVVDTHPTWATAMTRIIDDAARVPITHTQAAMGVDWDTSALAAGAYFVAGYTWEPDLNLWSPRPGVVLVVDTLGEDSPPAAALTSAAETLAAIANPGEEFSVEGCAVAKVGSTATFEYRVVEEAPTDLWVPFAEQVVDGADLAANFVPDSSMGGRKVDLRVRVVDTQQREVVAYTRRSVLVINDIVGETGDAGDAGESGDTGESGSESGSSGGGGAGNGCSIGSTGGGQRPLLPALAFALLCAVRVRRKRVGARREG